MTDEQEAALRRLVDQARGSNRKDLRDQLCAELEWAIAEIRALEGKTAAPKIEGYE